MCASVGTPCGRAVRAAVSGRVSRTSEELPATRGTPMSRGASSARPEVQRRVARLGTEARARSTRKSSSASHREVASSRDIVSYAEAAAVIGKPPNRIWQILDEISQSEHEQCRPMLPAVVVVASRGVPGYGFFTQAKKLGKPAPDPNVTTSISVQREFWKLELSRVHDWWASPA